MSTEKRENSEERLVGKRTLNAKVEKKGDSLMSANEEMDLDDTTKLSKSAEKPTFGGKNVPASSKDKTNNDDGTKFTKEIDDKKKSMKEIPEKSSLDTDVSTKEDLKVFGSSKPSKDSRWDERKEDSEEGLTKEGIVKSEQDKEGDELKPATKEMSLDDILKQLESEKETKFRRKSVPATSKDDTINNSATKSTNEKEFFDERKETVQNSALEADILTEEDFRAFGSHSTNEGSE
ncbi:hypothetical protein AVEN_116023-1 [Araneus ventricosus]|uniref:Uncharacterized protein n=1 Tax=Araneus ventricosus TaxID=182803 RepID=A0A4Y2V4K8_ARAVE|nr:hypothetical protein AVEN_2654-1 [Araneus ventricosus]GBO19487.1 hypothetical protein AVEN_116023-1 [Araneus ventricosus]